MNSLTPPRSLSLIDDLMKSVADLTGAELDLKLRSRIELKVKRRYQDLGYHSLQEYGIYFGQNEQAELKHLIAELSAHERGFFKEFVHFEFISEISIPEWLPLIRERPDRTLRIWSAGCGRGQEAYSLALYLNHFLKSYASDIKISITGTDSNAELIQIAKQGFFSRSEMREVPLVYMADHFERSAQNHVEGMKVKPSLSQSIEFKVLDLAQSGIVLKAEFFDLIFCRNLITHFNESQVKETVAAVLPRLHSTGALVVGLTESLDGLGLGISNSGSSVYRFFNAETEAAASKPALRADLTDTNRVKKIFCVSDSLSVQTLTKQILKHETGFEIIGEAASLEEATQKLEQWQNADAVTFYFETKMENLSNYREKQIHEGYPPFLLISSPTLPAADNAEAMLSGNTPLEIIGKPVLNHLAEFGEIFRAKLMTLDLDRKSRGKQFNSFEQFNKSIQITAPETKVRILISGVLHLDKTASYLKELQGVQAPIYLFYEECEAVLPLLAAELKRRSAQNCQFEKQLEQKLAPGMIRLLDFKKHFMRAAEFHSQDRASIGVMGELCTASSVTVLSWSPVQLLLEDLGVGHGTKTLNLHSIEVFPASSFAAVSSEYLQKK